MRMLATGSMACGMAILALAAPVQAQTITPAIANDLRCVAVISAIIGQMPEGTQRLEATTGVMYFVGRLDGAAPNLDLQAALAKELTTIKTDTVQAEVERCSKVLIAKGTKLQEIGKAMSQPK
jgi:hypothetical protein